MFDSPLIMADKVKEEKNTFLQSILNRGPNKRQIKPAENNSLLQLALGEDSEDSEEDEDFEINDDEGSGTDEEEDSDATMNKAPVSAPLEETSDNEGEVDGDDDDNEEDEMNAEPSSAVTVGDLIAAMKTKTKALSSQPSSVASSEVSASSKKVDIFICGICMDDVSDEGDEIVECDSCGITVHEGCYGINDEDSDSGKSNDSESPTELWFCDACKAGVQPDCELCPNLGGIFKETDTGQWVHLLCALYTPDVAFVKPEKLQCVTLSEMPPYKWGARDCSLCEDERFCRTGVCIECDAAMCKTYFHVTCAQMYGLLSDVPEECDEDVADPLFAHCRLHADKKITANRRRTWLAYLSCYKKFAERRSSEDKERAKQCLDVIQKEFKEKRLKNMPKLYSPTERVPRLLSTCPGACRQLFKKAELLGYSTGQTQSVVNVRRKWFVQPALTSEFVNYYHDRSARLKEMHERQEELQLNNKRLQEEEQDLREKYHELTETIQLLSDDIKERRQESVHLHRVLCKLAAKDLPKPAVLEAKKDEKSPESQKPVKPIKLHPCATCNKTENQHLLVRCDTCHNYYHLACVDPPLSRMPKRSAKCLWQCSECDSDDDDEEMEVDIKDTTPISQSRQRRVIKEPAKFTPDKSEGKKHRKLHRKRKIDSAEGESGAKKEIKKPKLEVTVKIRSEKIDGERKERKKKQDDVRTECSMCKQIGNNTNLVRCDNCQLCYHFHCLDPPVKSNPKKRGYLWYCTECDESDEEDSDEESEAKQPDSVANSNEKSKENLHGEQKKSSDGEETKKGVEKKEMAGDTNEHSANSSPCKEKKSA